MVRRVHHIDYVVKDLDGAVERYRAILGIEPSGRERLEGRGVETVRFKVGETYIILVQPVAAGAVQEYLDIHGEGFFHVAYEVDAIADEAQRLEAAGIAFRGDVPRVGIEGWRLRDLDPASTHGVECQLVEPPR